VRGARRIRFLLPLALLLALAIPTGAPAAIGGHPDREIVVYGKNDQTLVTFKRVKCKVSGKGNARKFRAKGSSDGWKLDVRANDFRGFGEQYDIEYGIRRTNFTLSPPGTKSYYSNFFFPGDQPPPIGGELALSGNGKDMGLGFIAAFYSGNDDDAVALVGHAKCSYPKRR
jgi:hypothetical protein